jgi:hypothetical protein
MHPVNNLDIDDTCQKRDPEKNSAKGSLIAVIISLPSLAAFFIA